MSSQKLSQSDFEDLSAYLDGEVPSPRREEIRQRLESDPAWRHVEAEMRQVDRALDGWAGPATPDDLADRIIRKVNRPIAVRIVRWLGPVAAAAVIALAILGYYRTHAPQPPAETGRKTVQELPPQTPGERNLENEFAKQNLDFFEDYDVLANFEDLEALDELESTTTGT